MGGVCGYLTYQNTASVLDLIKMAVAYFCIAAVALADLHEHKISNWFPLAMVIARVVIFIPELFLRRDDLLRISLSSVIGAAVCFLILYVMSVVTHGGFGLGDVKLLAALAFLCGAYAVCSTMLYSLILCVLISVFLLISRKKGMKDTIPFGPFIMIGYMCTLLLATF
jgi:leader peptidase (prepilin peptidase)/N-methyltransferase